MQFTEKSIVYMMIAVSVLCYLLISLLDKLLLVQHCYGEVVYVTPTPPPNQDCLHGVPCQTLQHYFNNKSLLEKRDNLTLIFISGEHTGFCIAQITHMCT